MELSKYQKDILDYIRNGTGNIIVQACAGSGKTTTLKEICLALDRSMSVIALCFNKINAVQFGEKLPKFVEASTMHSCGLKIIRNHVRGVKVDTDKANGIYNQLLGKPSRRSPADKELYKVLTKVVPLCRSTLRDISNINDVEYVLDNYAPGTSLELITLSDICETGRKVVGMCRDKRRLIDFDDMIDHVVYYGLTPSTHYDVILGDEVQDWNAQQSEFVRLLASQKKSPKPTGDPDILDSILSSAGMLADEKKPERPTESRIVLVGDRNQSIYAFRGADTMAMDNLKKTFQCEEFPLSVCYRCPTSVISEAQGVVGEDEILPADGAKEGVVEVRQVSDYTRTLRELPQGAMVLCRTNAPLLPAALQLIRDGRKACVRGRDIASNLISIVNKFAPKSDSIGDLIDNIRDWSRDKANRLMRNNSHAAAQAVVDQMECIRAVARECDEVGEVSSRINRIFSDDVEEVTFSSAHRSKGLEADYIVILAPELMPHPMALKYGNDESVQQEKNLKYVAVTRSMETLIYQPKPPTFEDECYGIDVVEEIGESPE